MEKPEVLEMIEFLRKNLTVEVSLNKEYDYDYTALRCGVVIKLGDEIIDSSSDSVSIKE